MIILVTGGSGSGKSLLAEKICSSIKKDRLYYFATMKIWDDECRHRIEKHRIQRAGKGFETVEVPDNLYDAAELPESSAVVLLECMSNLLANEQFSDFPGDPAERIIRGLEKLFEKSESAVIVSNEIFTSGFFSDEEMKKYAGNLGKINCWIAERADIVAEVTAGIPVIFKGKEIFNEIIV